MCFRRLKLKKIEEEDSYLKLLEFFEEETEQTSKLGLSQEQRTLIEELRKQVNTSLLRRNLDLDRLFSDPNENFILVIFLKKGDSNISKELGEFVRFSQKFASSYKRKSLSEEVYDRLFLKYRLWIRKLLLEFGILTGKEREYIESLDERVLSEW